MEIEEHHESHVVPPHRLGTQGTDQGTQPEDLLLLAPGDNQEEAIERAVDRAAAAEEEQGASRGIVEQAKNTAQRVLRGILYPAEGDVEGDVIYTTYGLGLNPVHISAWRMCQLWKPNACKPCVALQPHFTHLSYLPQELEVCVCIIAYCGHCSGPLVVILLYYFYYYYYIFIIITILLLLIVYGYS